MGKLEQTEIDERKSMKETSILPHLKSWFYEFWGSERIKAQIISQLLTADTRSQVSSYGLDAFIASIDVSITSVMFLFYLVALKTILKNYSYNIDSCSIY